MSNVIDLPCYTRLNIEPNKVISAALDNKLKHVVIVGETEDGKEYFASSVADGGDVLWYMERAKYKLMKITDDLSE